MCMHVCVIIVRVYKFMGSASLCGRNLSLPYFMAYENVYNEV